MPECSRIDHPPDRRPLPGQDQRGLGGRFRRLAPTGALSVERSGLLVVVCATSAGVHAALTPEHVRETAGAGGGLLVSAILLAGLCVWLTVRPQSAAPVGAAALLLAGLLAAYALATTTGVPLFHPSPETVDGLGLATKAVELVGLAAALELLVRGRTVGRLVRLQPKGTTT